MCLIRVWAKEELSSDSSDDGDGKKRKRKKNKKKKKPESAGGGDSRPSTAADDDADEDGKEEAVETVEGVEGGAVDEAPTSGDDSMEGYDAFSRFCLFFLFLSLLRLLFSLLPIHISICVYIVLCRLRLKFEKYLELEPMRTRRVLAYAEIDLKEEQALQLQRDIEAGLVESPPKEELPRQPKQGSAITYGGHALKQRQKGQIRSAPVVRS